MHFNTVAAGADVIFSFFDKSINECNVVGTPGSGFGTSGEGLLPVVGLRPSTIPKIKPPNTAPGMLPMPPMIAAMTLFKMEFIPMFGSIRKERPSRRY